MPLLEQAIRLITPFACLNCGHEGSLVCDNCRPEVIKTLPSRCYLCLAETAHSAVCDNCRPNSRLRHVWVATEMDGIPKQLLYRYKFERAQGAVNLLADIMVANLPPLEDVVVVPLPTATTRVRQRGYDHAKLLAKAVAKRLGAPYSPALNRLTQTRQVGTNRNVRLSQVEHAYGLVRSGAVGGRHVLLIDDVVTTGASLEAAARTLKFGASVKSVNGLVFAQRTRQLSAKPSFKDIISPSDSPQK